MSDAVYPALPGLTWPVKRTPVWATRVQTSASGREWRQSLTTTPRYRYVLPYEFLRNEATYAEFQTLFGFFNARRGSYDTFLFDDLADDTAVLQPVGIGNASQTAFQLVRSLGGNAQPIFDLGPEPVVEVAGVPQSNKLAPYGSFETDTNSDGLADGWTAYSSGTTGTVGYLRIGTSAVFGTYKQRVSASGLGTTAADRVGMRRTVSVVGGRLYTASVYAGNVTGTPKLKIYIDWLASGGGFISASESTPITAVGGLSRYFFTATAPAAAVSAVCYFWCESAATVSVMSMDFDGAQFQPGNQVTAFSDVLVTFANGVATLSSPPASGDAVTWSGTYYWRCRFDTDEMSFEQFMQQFWRTGEVRLITVKP